MATPLTDYLTDLGNDPSKQTAFQANPDAHMRAAGLSTAHQAVIKTKDMKQIASAVIAEHPGLSAPMAAAGVNIMLVIVIMF
jgi:hypothetical protein